MLIATQTYTGSTGATGGQAPSSYVKDNFVSDMYTVTVEPGWSTANTPTYVAIEVWELFNGANSLRGTIVLLDSSLVPPPLAGDGASLDVAGRTGWVTTVVKMTGGSSPTFTGTVSIDGQANRYVR
jgi:hypothetical protein